MVSTAIAGYEKWLPRPYERLSYLLHCILWQSCISNGTPMCLLKLIRFNIFFHDFPRSKEIDGPSRGACCKLQSPSHHLFNISPTLNFSGVSTILADDLLLVWHILYPMDVLGP